MKTIITYYRPVLKAGNMGHRCKAVAFGLQRHIMHHSDDKRNPATCLMPTSSVASTADHCSFFLFALIGHLYSTLNRKMGLSSTKTTAGGLILVFLAGVVRCVVSFHETTTTRGRFPVRLLPGFIPKFERHGATPEKRHSPPSGQWPAALGSQAPGSPGIPELHFHF